MSQLRCQNLLQITPNSSVIFQTLFTKLNRNPPIFKIIFPQRSMQDFSDMAAGAFKFGIIIRPKQKAPFIAIQISLVGAEGLVV